MTELKESNFSSNNQKGGGKFKSILQYIFVVLIGLMIGVGIQYFIGVRYTVSGESMYPTFNDKDEVIVSKFNKLAHLINRGDIVVFHADEEKDYIKRVIGVPGDEVRYKGDTLYINGKKVNEEYLKYNKEHKYGSQLTEDFTLKSLRLSEDGVIPDNKYLMLGDNRQNSLDSRIIGLVDRDEFVGEVVLRYSPKFTFDFKEDSFDVVNK